MDCPILLQVTQLSATSSRSQLSRPSSFRREWDTQEYTQGIPGIVEPVLRGDVVRITLAVTIDFQRITLAFALASTSGLSATSRGRVEGPIDE